MRCFDPRRITFRLRKINKRFIALYYMSSDVEVMNYILNAMSEACDKLDKAVTVNNRDDTAKIKKIILDLSNKFSEELK